MAMPTPIAIAMVPSRANASSRLLCFMLLSPACCSILPPVCRYRLNPLAPGLLSQAVTRFARLKLGYSRRVDFVCAGKD